MAEKARGGAEARLNFAGRKIILVLRQRKRRASPVSFIPTGRTVCCCFAELVRRHRPAAERLLPRPGRGAVGRGGGSRAAQKVPEDRARVDSQAAQERHVRVPVGSVGHSAHQVPVADGGRRSGPLPAGYPLYALRPRRLRLAHVPRRFLHPTLPVMHQVAPPSLSYYRITCVR